VAAFPTKKFVQAKPKFRVSKKAIERDILLIISR